MKVFKTAKDIDIALDFLKSKDKKLALVIDSFPKPKLGREKNYFKIITKTIIYQQLNGKAASNIFGRFIALYTEDGYPKPEQVIRTTIPKLRKAGLSERKASYIKDTAMAFLEDEISSRKINRMDDDEIREALIKIKGVGNWTVDMFLLFHLNRTDILPVGDYGIKQGFAKMFKLDELPDEDFMINKAKKWQPYRSTASWYLYRVADNGMPSRKK